MEDCLTSSIVFCHCFAIASATPHSLRVLVDSLPQVRIPDAPVRLLHTLQPALAMNPDLQDAKVIQVDLSDMSEPLGHQKSFPGLCSLSGVVAGSGCRFRRVGGVDVTFLSRSRTVLVFGASDHSIGILGGRHLRKGWARTQKKQKPKSGPEWEWVDKKDQDDPLGRLRLDPLKYG